MSAKITIFDTTLRDGEQCPGASMNLREKMEIARQLARLNVDVIEAGSPSLAMAISRRCAQLLRKSGANYLWAGSLCSEGYRRRRRRRQTRRRVGAHSCLPGHVRNSSGVQAEEG